MTVKVIIYDGDNTEWDEYVSASADSTNYHQFKWKTVIEKSFGHQTFYLAARDDTGALQGLLPLAYINSVLFGKFLVSLPFFNYGGLLYKEENVAGLMLKEAENILKDLGCEHLELRHRGGKYRDLVTREHKVTMILDLAEDIDAQWKGFNAKLRNQIRKAEKSGLEIRVGHAELLDGFYDVFARNMRDLGTPVYSKSFFAAILESFPDNSKIIAVFFEKKLIAAGIASWFRDTLEIPWASSIKKYKLLCPNNMLYWAAIRFAINNGFRKFDFGRSTPGEGTFRFKEQWGAIPVKLYWQYIMGQDLPVPELNPNNSKYVSAIKLWKKLPVPLTRIIGPLIVRNIP